MEQPNSGRRPTGGLVRKISSALRDSIQGGDLKPGDRLPSEVQLTERFGVSRTVVREAIASLRLEALVEARQGAGVFVLSSAQSRESDSHAARATVASALETLEFRTPIEIEAAGLAASRRSPAQEEEILERHADVLDCIRQGTPIRECDFALHLAIARASNNPRFAEFLLSGGVTSIPQSEIVTRGNTYTERNYHDQLAAEHERIVLAISRGDADEAREAMRQHLRGSQIRHRELLHRARLAHADES